jgi:hypothetical protein
VILFFGISEKEILWVRLKSISFFTIYACLVKSEQSVQINLTIIVVCLVVKKTQKTIAIQAKNQRLSSLLLIKHERTFPGLTHPVTIAHFDILKFLHDPDKDIHHIRPILIVKSLF